MQILKLYVYFGKVITYNPKLIYWIGKCIIYYNIFLISKSKRIYILKIVAFVYSNLS